MDFVETVTQVATWLTDLPDVVKGLSGIMTLVGAYHATRGISRNAWWLARHAFRLVGGPQVATWLAAPLLAWWNRPSKATLDAQHAAAVNAAELAEMRTTVARLTELVTAPAPQVAAYVLTGKKELKGTTDPRGVS